MGPTRRTGPSSSQSPIIGSLDRLSFQPWQIGTFFGILTYLIRLPFVLRYDLHFGGDAAVWYLMAVRVLQGHYPLYFYSQDYEGTVETYILAFFFKIFGPSIQLGGALILVEWALAVGIGVYLLIQGTSKFHGIVGGIIAAVGVPYTLTYTTVPFSGNPAVVLLPMLFMLQVFFILRQGPALWRFALLGFSFGIGWYITKKCLPAMPLCLLPLVLFKTDHWDIRRSFRPVWIAVVLGAVLVGDLPDLIHRFYYPPIRHVLGIATWGTIPNNLRCALTSSLAYFDAHPISRMPDGLYFWAHLPFDKTHPESPLDWAFTLIAACVWTFTVHCFWKGAKEKNPALFLVAGLMLFNFAALVFSGKTNADTINARRYFYPSSVGFSLMTGLFFSTLFVAKFRLFKALAPVLGFLFLGGVLFHFGQLLTAPDEMREFRWLIQELDKNKIDRVLADWPNNLILDGLTTQRIIAAETHPNFIPEYGPMVAQAKTIAFVGMSGKDPVEPVISFQGRNFRKIGAGADDGFFFWAPYEAAP